MESLKVWTYEVITGLALLGQVHLYLALQSTAWIINPTLVMGELIALYAVTSVASEAMIVSSLRPATRQVLAVNVLIATIVTEPAWNHTYNLVVLVGIAIATAILRMVVAAASLRASKVGVRRFTSALVGAPLLLATTRTAFDLAREAYYNYYLFPRFKERYIMPTRWQDLVALITLWGGIFLLLYISYRLLKFVSREVPGQAWLIL